MDLKLIGRLMRLSFSERGQSIFLFGAVVAMAFMDIASLGMVIPALNYFINPVAACDGEFGKFLCFFDEWTSLLIPCIFLGLIFAKLTLLRRVTKLTFLMGSNLALGIIKSSFDNDVKVHIERSSATYIGAVTSRVSTATIQTLLPIVQSSANVLVLFVVLGYAFLQFREILLAITIPIVLFYIGYGLIVKTHLRRRGETINRSLTSLTRVAGEIFRAQKELRVYGTEQETISQFWAVDRTYRSAHADNVVFAQYPRYIVETLIILVLLGLIYSGYLLDSESVENSSNILGVAVIAFRILPLGQYIFNSWTAVKAHQAILSELLSLISDPLDTQRVQVEVNNTIEIRDGVLNKHASGEPLLNKINFELRRGDIVYLMGPSGSGKSTLLELFLGFRKLSQGTLLADGEELDCQKTMWHNGFAYVPQRPLFFDDSLRKNITLGRSNISDDEIIRHLRGVGLSSKMQLLPHGLDSSLGEDGKFFSGGEAQRVGIVRALLGAPTFVFLDECTSALDQAMEEKVLNYVFNELSDSGILFVTHKTQKIRGNSLVWQIPGPHVS